MAKDVITRFKLETTAFDSAIKQASKELSDYSKTATKAKEGFNQFTKSNVDAARALGTMDTSSNNLKGKLQELVGAYNEGVKAYRALSDEHKKSDWAQALAGSLTQLQGRIKETKAELQGLGDTAKNIGGGGLFGGGKLDGMLQVFGGNIMTKAAGMAASFASEMADLVTQSIEVAKSAEGIRLAYDRLNQPNLMAQLKEQTHGVVSELELMKAAVKFNDFKLPVEELGTMLAFAQQKAKDTGQSVDYMVDSIVTGLGRKSLMILDNLGLSAAEIKEKMAETGDMTKAVGQIIREQLEKAGDYVETAADIAAQADADLRDAMLRLGETFAPVEQAGASMWNTLKVGALDVLNNAVKPLINALTEAGRLRSQYAKQGGTGKVQQWLSMLGDGGTKAQSTYQRQQKEIWGYINKRENYMKDRARWMNSGDKNEELRQSILSQQKSFGASNVKDVQAQIDAAKKMLREYQEGAKFILKPTKVDIDTNGATQDVDTLKVKLAELEAQRKKAIAAGDTGKSNDLLKKINQVKKDIKGLDPNALNTTTNTKTEQTEIQKNQKEIDTLTKKYQKLSDAEKTATGDALKGIKAQKVEIQGNIKQLQDRNKELKRMADEAQGVNQFPEGSLPALNKQLRELQEAQSKAANGEEYRKLGAEIDTVTRKIAILKGELPKGETATITVSVDADKVDDLRNSLEQIDDKKMKVTVDYTDNSGLEDVSDQERTVTFTADDRDVVAKVLEMQHINIDPKTLEFRANDAETMKAVEGMKNITFDKKTLTVIPQTQEAAKELLKMNTFKMVDKQVAVTVNDDKAMKDLQAVAKVTIPDKEVKVKVTNPKAVDMKVNEVAGTQHQAPTLKPIEQTVNYKQGDVDLQDIPDEKTVRVDYEQGDMPDIPDDEQRTVTFKADNSDVLSKVADIKGITIDPKMLTFKADDTEALQAAAKIQGVTIDEKTMTVKAQTLEAAKQVEALNGIKLDPKTLAIKISTDDPEVLKTLQQKLDSLGLSFKLDFKPKEPIDKSLFNEQNLNAKIADLKNKMRGITIDTQEWFDMKGLLADAQAFSNMLQVAIKNGKDVTALNLEDFWKKIFGGTDIATEELQSMLDQINAYLKENGLDPIKINFETGEMPKDKSSGVFKESMQKYDKLVGGLTQVASGLKNLGIELPEGVNKFLSGLQGISQIIQGVSSILSVFGIGALGTNTAALGFNTTALGVLTGAMYTNSFAKTIPFLSTGGMNKDGRIIHAAVGTVVPGNYGHDAVPAMLTSGEVVLNRAEVGNLASQLQGGTLGDLHMEARFDMDGLHVALNNDSKWRSKGVYMTSKMR